MSHSQAPKVMLKKLKSINKIWHPESTLVFKSLEDKKVIGRFCDNEFIPLDNEALSRCSKWGFNYDPELVEEEEEEVEPEEVEPEENQDQDQEVEQEVEPEVEPEEYQDVQEVEQEEGEPEENQDQDQEEVEQEVEQEVEPEEDQDQVEQEVTQEVEPEKVIELQEGVKQEERIPSSFDTYVSKISTLYLQLTAEKDKYQKLYHEEVLKNQTLTKSCEELENSLQSLNTKFENMKKIFSM